MDAYSGSLENKVLGITLDSKPYVCTLARFNETCLLEHDPHAFKVLEKALPLTSKIGIMPICNSSGR